MVRTVTGFEDLQAAGGLRGPALVAFFGDFSDQSRQAWPAFQAFCERHSGVPVFLVDVGTVKDVHRRLGVTRVPTVALVKDGALLEQVVGPRTIAEYEAALLGRSGRAAPPPPPPPAAPGRTAAPDPASPRRVTVYTGAHCPWCTRVKAYLRQRKVPFTEIDVSLEPAQAEALVRRTGQTGVPQIDIDGQFVIGFDQRKIDALLGLS